MGLGVGFTPFETRTDVIVRVSRHAEEIGLDRVDVAEGWTHDSMIILAELAGQTSRIGLGTGIVSVWGRTPATMALGAAGLQRLTGGRFSLGIGAGSPPLAEGFHGVPWERPLARMRETLVAVRALLAGERCRTPRRMPLRLGVAPEAPVPIMLAALAPGGVRLAGARRRLDPVPVGAVAARGGEGDCRGGRAAGRDADAHARVAWHPGRARPGRGRRPEARGLVALDLLHAHGPALPDHARRALRHAGRGGGGGGGRGRRRATELPAAAEELARDVTLFGSYDDAGDTISSWLAAGADNVNLVLPPGHPEEELMEFLDVAGSAGQRPASEPRPEDLDPYERRGGPSLRMSSPDRASTTHAARRPRASRPDTNALSPATSTPSFRSPNRCRTRPVPSRV